MNRKVTCVLLKQEADGLAAPPWPGELGQKIFNNVSLQAWQQWLAHQTMLINENRLSPLDPEHRRFIEQEMEKFFFGQGSAKPEGYVPPEPE